jgi:hypothetical protein
MATGMRAPTSPVGRPDVLWGVPGQGGLLTEWAETVPDLTWPESIRTYGRMRRDSRLAAVIKAFFLPVIRATWVVDPAGVNRSEAVDLVAGDLGLPVLGQKGPPPAAAAAPGFSWHEHLRLAMNHLVYGHMPFEQWYVIRGGRTHLAGLQERQPFTISIIDVDEDTGLIKSVSQNTQAEPIAANRLVWYVNEREGANWAGISLLRPAYTPWILKHETMRVHATAIRRFGMGVPQVSAPPGGTPSQVEEARRLAAGMRAGDTAGAGMPDGFQFSLVGLTGSVPDAVAFLQFLNQEMTGSALAQFVELANSTYGSRAVGESFLDLFLLSLQAVADSISATASTGDPAMPGVARSLVEYNWGEGEPYPRIVANDVGDRHEITAAAISALVTSGALPPDPELDAFLREAYGLPKRSTSFPPPAPPKAPPPPGHGGGGGGNQPPPEPGQPGNPARAAAPPRADGLGRDLTPAEVRAGLDPAGIRHEIETAATRVMGQLAPVLTAQRADLADQVTAAVDDGHLDALAQLAVPTGQAAGLLYRAMAAVAAQAAGRMIGEAAGQGVTIDPAAVRVNHARLRQIAQARAAMAGQALAAAASRRALQVVSATAGTEAAREVTATLAGMSTTSLADQLLAAMSAAGNEGRFAVLDAGPQAAYTASEILDANTCAPCAGIDGHVFASLDDARAAYANGAYTGCLGALRCRGTVVANWDDVTAEPPPFPASAAFREDEARDRGGKWTRDGGLLPKGPETPIPADHPGNRILDTWVAQGGSGKLDARQRDVLNAMVGYYGKQVPAGLVRGEHDQPASRYKPGKVLRLAPASFSTEETSALPYAEAGDRNQAVLHVTFPQGLKGLNVSGRAEAEGFNEQEWVVAAKFRVTGSHVDGEGITHVQIRYAANVEAAAEGDSDGRWLDLGGGAWTDDPGVAAKFDPAHPDGPAKAAFNPDEPRDEHGRWGLGGGTGPGKSGGHLSAEAGATIDRNLARFRAQGQHYPVAAQPLPDRSLPGILAQLDYLGGQLSGPDRKRWDADPGVRFTRYALDRQHHTEPDTRVHVVKDDKGQLAGAISFSEHAEYGTRSIHVHYLGTTGTAAGAGTALAVAVARYAAARHLGVAGIPLDQAAEAFWRKVGWHPNPLGVDAMTTVWGWTPEEAAEVATRDR